VLMGYLDIFTAPFTNLVAFKRICLALSKRLVEGTQTPQYLAFTSVSQENLDEIDRIREERWSRLPRMTILYDGREEILIVKLMVGVMHEGVAHEFASMFDWKLVLLGIDELVAATGSGRFGRHGGRSKEPDVGFKPCSRPREDEWPSFVIEVGVSELVSKQKSKATSARRREKKYRLTAYDLCQFDLIFASYFLHPFISLTLASSPIRKHARYALSKLFMAGNQAVQNQLKNKEKSILRSASSLLNEHLLCCVEMLPFGSPTVMGELA